MTPACARPMLALTRVSKSHPGAGGRMVLRDIELVLGAGEYIAVMGESGVGKSTLLNLIAGIDRPDSGRIVLDGVDIAALDDDARTLTRRARMGFVFQAFYLLPHLTVLQNVALPLRIAGQDRESSEQRAYAMLEAVALARLAARYPRSLSGGEMQRAAIARALVHVPRLVLADEPTGNLDADSARHVLALLRDQIKREGGGGLLVTHSAQAAATADRTYVLTAAGLQPQRAPR